MIRLLLTLTIFNWSHFLNAQTSQDYQSDSLQSIKLNEVIIRPSSEPDIPAVSSSLSSSQLEQYTPDNIVPAINTMSGVYIQSGAINTNRITIRGVGSRTLYGTNKIKAYFNEIPITNGVGETAIDLYNSQDLSSIEIIKGPKSTIYGTGLGGTLLLQTKSDEISNIESSFSAGSFGTIKSSSGINLSKKKVALHFNYDHLQTDGYRDNSKYNRDTYLLSTDHTLNENNTLNVLVNHIAYKAEIPSSIGKTAFEENPSSAATNWSEAQGYEDHLQTLAGLSLAHQFNSNLSNTTSIFYNYTDHYEPRPFNILEQYSHGYGARTVFINNFALLGATAKWSVGGEWYQDQIDWSTIENLYEQNNGNGSLEGDLLSNNHEQRNRMDIFSSLTMPLSSQLTVLLGLNINKTNYDFRDEFNIGSQNQSASRSFDPIVAPNVTFNYLASPSLKLSANVSRGFNFPNLEETLTPEGAINPEIGPEKGWNYEVDADLLLDRNRLHANAALYWMDIHDLLVAERVGEDQYIGRNAGRTTHKGIEVSIRYRLSPSSSWTFTPSTNASFNFHKFNDFVDQEDNFSGNELTGVPNRKISSGLSISHSSGVYTHINHLYVGSMPMNDENNLYSQSFALVNAKLGYKNTFSDRWMLDISTYVNNVTNEHYASSILINATGFGNSEPRYYYPGNPRNFLVNMKLAYLFKTQKD